MATNTNDLSDELKECLNLLKEIMSRNEAEPFLQPVDWEALNLPDYPLIIKNPMDLGTIKSNIECKKYDDAYDFAEDVRLVWKNAKTYNTPGSPIYNTAESLSGLFERKFPTIRKKFSARSKYGQQQINESSQEDRMKFAKLIKQITSDQLGQVVEIIDKKSPQALNDSEGEEDLEIEVYFINNDTLQELIGFCEKCIKKANKTKKTKK
mmetsp:Transcript_12258/g.18467  ORF Transcript_12258/g.18467 Transcript_12258/m.18467 type:complete len:209 (-) Transcript_12258:155-781(-)|eukprot:CAMPEP_0202687590 /NCGR_PEP_ID=MMETSP1385-20130828/3251_1 /ASSEMBLY_ACC=CAM_ASM_000861 /TAXON_ID=933848 /ORGANISM="Elphidium margaritaceum" /LENGTH=208 /DNA_ID=CAMNT_0049342411 /DNA_START=167 /DNA_END=793 /DNA_ORIENTATION=-